MAALTFLLYWPVHQFDFVQYDDPDYIFENPTVRNGLSWWGLTWAFVDAHVSNWHPVTWLSHMLDCQLFGLNAGRHHLVSASLHAINAALLFLLVRAMTGAFWRSALVAALFAWHPLRVESVAWISERKDVLSGFFFLLTLWTYVLYAKRFLTPNVRPGERDCAAETETSGDRFPGATIALDVPNPPLSFLSAAGLYRLSLVFFILGLLSKPMLMTVPGVLLLLDVWPLNRLPLWYWVKARDASAVRDGWPELRALLVEKLPFAVVSGIAAVVAVAAQKSGGAMINLQSEGIASRLGTAVAGVYGYLEKTFWPQDLAVLYLRPHLPPVFPLVTGIFLLLGVSAVALLLLSRRPYLLVGWCWFLGMLLPVIGLVQVGLQSMADRYTYLPAIGVYLIIAWGLRDLVVASGGGRETAGLVAGCITALLLGCILCTRHQLEYWRNTETLMNQALRVDPGNYVAHENLAVHFTRLGNQDQARFHRKRAMELVPDTKGKDVN
ncbi:MAG TPA: hypothetical protein VEC99_17185 [Clostridia bacterium]|nr:hypothetical protein [Clostridia bacterium]